MAAGKAIVDALVIGPGAEEWSRLGAEEVRRRALREVRRYFPRFRPGFAHVHHWPEAACLLPDGAMAALGRFRQDDSDGVRGLFLAGDYLSVPSLSGALWSGLEAAREAARFLGKTGLLS